MEFPMKALLRRRFRRRRLSRQQPQRNHFLECLESRHMMAADDVITVGRVPAAWTISGVTNNQLKITYSVYNQQTQAVSGVLLTTTLNSDVTFVDASILPDRNGQQLAWSLGTIAPYGRASVEVTVAFAGPVPLQMDSGAKAFGSLNAG